MSVEAGNPDLVRVVVLLAAREDREPFVHSRRRWEAGVTISFCPESSLSECDQMA